MPGEGEVVATLVRRTLDADPRRDARRQAVLLLPGWDDYFFQVHLAELFEANDYTVYALDPRRAGRSLRNPDYRDYVESLDEVASEIDAAFAIIAAHQRKVIVHAHSTGGLTAALWASKNPGRLAGLALNAPWLGLWGPGVYAPALERLIGGLASMAPLFRFPLPDPGMGREVREASERWGIDLALKAPSDVPVRAGWLSAILDAQRRVRWGLGIEAPIFVACSTRSTLLGSRLRRGRTSDVVLDVHTIARLAPRLGRRVHIERIDRGVHDLTLSQDRPRQDYLDALGRWLSTIADAPCRSQDRK